MYYLIGYVMYIALTIGVLFYLLVYRSHISLLWKKVWTSITLVGVLIFTILCTSFLPFRWINILFYIGVIVSYILIFSAIYLLSSFLYNKWLKHKGQQTEGSSWKTEIEQLRKKHQKKKENQTTGTKPTKTSRPKRKRRETPLFVEREKVAKKEKVVKEKEPSIQEEIKQWNQKKEKKELKKQPIKAVTKQKKGNKTKVPSPDQKAAPVKVETKPTKNTESVQVKSKTNNQRPKNIQDYAPKMNTTSKVKKPKSIKKFNNKK
ncbi:hypothetical protein [Catellicoccus marimammalium]|uniref:Uncharacterized protein n=1 Tax=Catellicoccus marimammalium M35/04/3 TaxID=1234409 RepID=K8ZBF7_9ENTE|nr:hypothetical protein [Catellicoccus marimammalium]EKU27387.1 hypothetical protein C683_0718 [Catellicoccus marimammalium M35/04/3]